MASMQHNQGKDRYEGYSSTLEIKFAVDGDYFREAVAAAVKQGFTEEEASNENDWDRILIGTKNPHVYGIEKRKAPGPWEQPWNSPVWEGWQDNPFHGSHR